MEDLLEVVDLEPLLLLHLPVQLMLEAEVVAVEAVEAVDFQEVELVEMDLLEVEILLVLLEEQVQEELLE